MKTGKRILSIFMTMLLVALLVPLNSFAYSGDLSNLHWTLENGTLTITGVGAMNTATKSPWYNYREQIRSAVISEGVTTIGQYAFSGCSNMTDISIPETVNQIGNNAFSSCANLSSINLPDAITLIGDGAFQSCYKISEIIIPGNTLVIGQYAFRNCSGLVKITVPNTITRIGAYAFYGCSSLESFIIPDKITAIESSTFSGCSNLSSVTIPSSVTSIGTYAFSGCSKLFSISIPEGVSVIDNDTFYGCTSLLSVVIPKSVTKINPYAFNQCASLKDVYYQGDMTSWQAITIGGWNAPLNSATIHYNEVINPPIEDGGYKLKIDTYNFKNYDDSDSSIGHCFGMSITSSAYYLGILDKSIIGDKSKPLYSFENNATVRAPICYYQMRQGSCAQKAIVAGGSYYKRGFLNKKSDILSDWVEVVNYVGGHSFDGKGSLQLSFVKGDDLHAVNFLRYEVVDGEGRIYVYDNMAPKDETAYFFMNEQGEVIEKRSGLFSSPIDSICLRDVATYFEHVNDFSLSHVIYVLNGLLSVDGATAYPMEGEFATGGLMYELPDDLTQVKITPLVDNAEFTYMEKTYTFGKIDDDTYGILTLAATEDDTGSLTIENAPEESHTHLDADNDGYCDTCEEMMQGGQHCKFCGKIHDGLFGWLVKFFHSIFAIFKR